MKLSPLGLHIQTVLKHSIVCTCCVLLVLGTTGCSKEESATTKALINEGELRRPVIEAKTPEEAFHYIDSLEQSGAISVAMAEILRSYPYRGNHPLLEEQHLKRAYELFSQDPSQEWDHYADAAYKYAVTQSGRGDIEKAVKILTETLRNIEGQEVITGQMHSNLLLLLGGYQYRIGVFDEGKRTYERAYQEKAELVAKREDSPLNLLLLCVTATELMFENKDYATSLDWRHRTEQVFQDNIQYFDSITAELFREYIAIGKMRVLVQQGRADEAARMYANTPHDLLRDSQWFGAFMTTYLEDAKRYSELADTYDYLDRRRNTFENKEFTFETFNDIYRQRYIANRKAGRNERAMIFADTVFNNMDSAFVRLKRTNAAELAVVYQTHAKELALKDAQAESRIHRNLFISAFIIIVLISYLFIRSHQNNKELRAKNRSLFEQIQQREQEEQDKLQTLQAQPEETLTSEQQLYRRLCALMAEKQPYTDEELNRETLAKMLDTNSKYVVDAIRECSHGETVTNFITRYRLEHVTRLLKTTDAPINLIGEQSGIPSRTTLSRLFRNTYGMTCSEYRQAAAQTTKE